MMCRAYRHGSHAFCLSWVMLRFGRVDSWAVRSRWWTQQRTCMRMLIAESWYEDESCPDTDRLELAIEERSRVGGGVGKEQSRPLGVRGVRPNKAVDFKELQFSVSKMLLTTSKVALWLLDFLKSTKVGRLSRVLFNELTTLANILAENCHQLMCDDAICITICYCDVLPNLSISLRILLTVPVTVASGERSFSRLELITVPQINNDAWKNEVLGSSTFQQGWICGGLNPPWTKSQPPKFVLTPLSLQSYDHCDPLANFDKSSPAFPLCSLSLQYTSLKGFILAK